MTTYDKAEFWVRYSYAFCRMVGKYYWAHILFYGIIVGLIFGTGYWVGSC